MVYGKVLYEYIIDKAMNINLITNLEMLKDAEK